jgi:hypothetical protein
MSRLSGDLVVVRDAATKLTGDATALTTFTAAFAASAAALIDIADGLVADATALAALNLGVAGPMATGPGTGADGMDAFNSRVQKELTGLQITEILLDIDGLTSEATDNDILGEAAAANAHVGQIVAAESGVVTAGRMACLQTPAGGEVDIDLYSNASGTLSAGADGTGGTALLERGADWTSADDVVLTGVPAANEYLYLTVGTASTPTAGTYTAGIFLITFYGV